jgi:hypothetical protein
MCLIQHAAAAFSNPPGSGEGAPAASIIDWNFPQDPTALGAAASDEYPGGREGAASGPGSLGADSAEEFERAVWGQIRCGGQVAPVGQRGAALRRGAEAAGAFWGLLEEY